MLENKKPILYFENQNAKSYAKLLTLALEIGIEPKMTVEEFKEAISSTDKKYGAVIIEPYSNYYDNSEQESLINLLDDINQLNIPIILFSTQSEKKLIEQFKIKSNYGDKNYKTLYVSKTDNKSIDTLKEMIKLLPIILLNLI